ncbi:MAG: hypothetical protein Q8P18_32000 [Pseudomonadota bacterium]|nr:hypothetical protein [Pseudomonadota bacterium]
MRARLRAVFAWMRSTRAWLVLNPLSLALVAFALAGGGAAGVPVGDGMYTYMWQDARFCDDCHVHDYANEAWERSAHSRLTTCHDCHRVPIRHYPSNLYLALFDRPQVPEDIPQPDVGVVICEQCHSDAGDEEPLTGPLPEDLRALVVKVDGSPLHRVHLDAKAGESGPIECLDCHGGRHLEVHRFTATSEACVACHDGVRPEDESGRTLSCLDCHQTGFLGRTGTGVQQ